MIEVLLAAAALLLRSPPPRSHVVMDGNDSPMLAAQLARTTRPLSSRDAARRGLSLSVLKAIDEVPQAEWDACARTHNPFVSWAFLHALEASESCHPEEGWMPQHLVAMNSTTNKLVGAVPLYLKSHSFGEYVFDQSWARAYRSTAIEKDAFGPGAGCSGYYPKLQSCVPFTPVTGARLLVADSENEAQLDNETAAARRDEIRTVLARGLVALAERLGVSGVHVTFSSEEERPAFCKAGFLPRLGVQYHWTNDNYQSFDQFLDSLKQSRRKAIRQERRKVRDAGIVVKRLKGREIESKHWDALHEFYTATVAQKWGRGYLTRDFFRRLGEDEMMASRSLLVVAEEEETGELVAGALNLIGDDCLYGRHWGCAKRFDALHFELCYYQAIEAAIELGLPRVEAGAQGEHKLTRGYLPTLTHSAHYLRHQGFRKSVGSFLKQEREQTYISLASLAMRHNPFKKEAAEHLKTQGLRVEGKKIVVE